MGAPRERRRVAPQPDRTDRRSYHNRPALLAALLLAIAAVGALILWAWPLHSLTKINLPGIGARADRGAPGVGADRDGAGTGVGDAASEALAARVDAGWSGPGGALVGEQHQSAKLSRGLSAHTGGGLLVDEAPTGTIAKQLGLHRGDIILSVNGVALSSPDDFARIYLEQGRPRQIAYVRDGETVHRHP